MFNQGNNNNNMYEQATNSIKKLYNELDYPIDVFPFQNGQIETKRDGTKQMI